MEKSIDSTKSDKQNSEIILFDSSANLEDLKSVLRGQKIITFDMESHELLTKNNIIHEISDNYAQKFDDIQKLSYRLSSWYDEPHIAKDITYDEINVGKLFYVEFHYFLVPFIKKFSELISIITKYENHFIIASPYIYKLALCLKTDKIDLIGKEHTTSFLYDSFKIRISNNLTIKISNTNYQRLKDTAEKIISFFFKPKIKNKSILLVEFDPIKYNKFLHLSKSRLHITLFNRRRPTIWNVKSLFAVQKSKCGIVTQHDVLNIELKTYIKQQTLFFKKKFHTLITDNDEFFAKFFTINNISFWPALKPFFLDLAEKRITNAILEIEITKRILEKYPFNAILVWSENGFNEQITIGLAKKKKIPVIMLQHGMYYDSIEALEFNQFAGVLPTIVDIIACWGESFKKSLEKWGFESKKIKAIGNPVYDNLFTKKLKKIEKKFVLLATSPPVENIASDLSIETRTNYINCIIKTCKILTSLNKNVVVKLHPFQEEFDVSDIVKSVDPKISVIKKGDIINLIQLCEFVIIIDISTVILEAQIIKKPVISISIKNYNMGESEVFTSNSVIKTDLKNFETTLNKFLNDPTMQKTQISNANKFLANYLSNQGTASQKLVEFLEQICSTPFYM
jgi:hypothetical protein